MGVAEVRVGVVSDGTAPTEAHITVQAHGCVCCKVMLLWMYCHNESNYQIRYQVM